MRTTDEARVVKRELEAAGAEILGFEMGGKHPKVRYRWRGKDRFYVLSGTPGKSAQNAARAGIRRDLGLTTRPKRRRKPARPKRRRDVCRVDRPQPPETITPGLDPWAPLAPLAEYLDLAQRYGRRFADVIRRIDTRTAEACARIRGLVR